MNRYNLYGKAGSIQLRMATAEGLVKRWKLNDNDSKDIREVCWWYPHGEVQRAIDKTDEQANIDKVAYFLAILKTSRRYARPCGAGATLPKNETCNNTK